MATVELIAAAGLAMVMFVLLANLVVAQYGRGVVRAAVDEAVRAGSRSGVAACQERAREVTSQLLGGPFGAGVAVSCAAEGPVVVARAGGSMPGWLPGVPDIPVTWEARAPRELP